MTDTAAPSPIPAAPTHDTSIPDTATHDTARGFGIASLVLGATSLLTGWTFIAPIVGLVLGLMSRRRQPDANGWSTAGIVLNSVALVGWVLAALGIVAFGAFALFARVIRTY